MFCILIPVLTLPIMTVMWWGTRPNRVLRAEIKAAQAARRQEPFSARAKRELKRTFWQLDLIGLVLFIIGFGLFFVTITTANSRTARWSDAHSIAQLVLGAVVIAAFVVWERSYAPHPLLPFALLRRKTVVGCTLIALLSPMGGRITANYLLTFLQVAAGEFDLIVIIPVLTIRPKHQERNEHYRLPLRRRCHYGYSRFFGRSKITNSQMVHCPWILPPSSRYRTHAAISNIHQLASRTRHCSSNPRYRQWPLTLPHSSPYPDRLASRAFGSHHRGLVGRLLHGRRYRFRYRRCHLDYRCSPKTGRIRHTARKLIFGSLGFQQPARLCR